MSREGLATRVPCGVCAEFIGFWLYPYGTCTTFTAMPCRHTADEIERVRRDALALGDGLPVGTPIQRKPAPRDPAEGR